jgi:radical SAM protein with 4Fe4S-binding SPASM domain
MYDINFYIETNEFKKKLASGSLIDREEIFTTLEEARSKNPVIYNIETTNACNMRCKMCPRTTMMTRDVQTIDPGLFKNIVNQISPHSPDLWSKWENYVYEEYGIATDMMSENHFFLTIIPKVIQLHGYGDPLLDENMPQYVKLLTDHGIPSYFSCNPANIDINKTVEMFKNGLDYIKYSIESINDQDHKKIRGEASNFSISYNNILQLLDIKKRYNYKTTIIITMLDLNRENQKEEYELLRKSFEGLDVYIYLKSEDQQWYRKEFHGTNSIHWSEFCKHPWMSMTVKSNGEVAMCMEDFNNEIVLGDTKNESLYDIWNGNKYLKFRKDHLYGTKGIKCTERCDMKIINDYL